MISYDSSSIKIFKGLEAVRKRPGMYIGNTEDGSGLHKMIFEVVDNSIDEYLVEECDLIEIFLHNNGYVTIIDNGRGMPVDFHQDEGISAAEVIMTVLHSGAKFDEKSYKISGGLHGVGVSVVNALSSNLILKIFRSGFVYEQKYCFGKPLDKLDVIGKTEKRGTEISFLPDSSIFKFINFDYQILFDRFIELAYLNSGIKIILTDERKKNFKQDVFFESGGLKAFLEYINKSEKVVHKDILYFSDIKDEINVNVALQWTEESKESMFCYTNNILQKDGGSHLVALKIALTKVLKPYIEDAFLKKSELVISGDDIREGLVVILSIYMANPKFSSQIKDKLISSEARQVVEYILTNKLKEFFYENPSISKLISNKIIISARAREAARKARDLSKKKSGIEAINLHGKLSECQEKNPILSELFLVEGDSAGGSAKQARDRRTQAILPLKGKILNVERSGFERILLSTELRSVVSALKCGVGSDDYDEKKLRYHKVIFMTDADVDGAHIKTLLLTFFYRQMPMLIENGHIFVSNPPLFRVSNKDEFFYIKDKIEFNDFLFNKILDFFKKKNWIVDYDFLTNIIFSYKKLMNVLDKLAQICPKIFFEKLIYFNDKIPNYKHKEFIYKIKLYEQFLNKNIGIDQSVDFNLDDFSNNLLTFNLVKYGISKEFKINCDFFVSNEYQLILEFNDFLNRFFLNVNSIKFDNLEYNFYKFSEFISFISSKILSCYDVQRYKGLGEMNPQQLWDTSMNPKTRILKVVKIKDVVNANDIFSSLMGENIESRKNFIDKNINALLDFDF